MVRRVGCRVALGVAVTLLAASCSTQPQPPQPSSSGSASASPTPVKLLLWDAPESPAVEAEMRSLVAEFEVSHPGITVDYVPLGPDELFGRFEAAAQTASGAPDVLRLPLERVSNLAAEGFIAPLAPVLDDPTTADLVPSGASAASLDGRLYALPQTLDTLALYVNAGALKARGLRVPRSWEEVQALRRQLTGSALAGFDTSLNGFWLLPFLYSEGCELLNVGAKKVLVAEPDCTYGLTLRTSLGTAAPVQATNPNDPDRLAAVRTAFIQGRLAVTVDSLAAHPLLAGPAGPSDVAVVPFPAGSTGRSVTPVSGSGLAVFNGTPSVSAADTLAEFLSDARAQTAMLYGAGSLPALRSVLSSTQVTTNPVREVFARALLTAKSLPSIEQSTNLLPPLSGALRSTLTGQKLPQPAMSAVAESYLSLFQGWSLP